MCKAPKPPKPKEPKKPEFLRNRYLDEFIGDAQAVNSLRTGRSSLRIPLKAPGATTGTPTSGNPATNPPSTILTTPENTPLNGGDFRGIPRRRLNGPRTDLR